ncbi:hypothetical protein M3699_26455 [Peribacillus simplex]|nr:hypothetical protein [Peribacillus simplex]MCM3677235.1 hypothetical protein [Peribacillus simplex]
MEKQLLTMAQIAKQLNLGEGRKKRYKSETVEVLRFIAEGFKRNLNAT